MIRGNGGEKAPVGMGARRAQFAFLLHPRYNSNERKSPSASEEPGAVAKPGWAAWQRQYSTKGTACQGLADGFLFNQRVVTRKGRR